eukprot:gene18829-24608_t
MSLVNSDLTIHFALADNGDKTSKSSKSFELCLSKCIFSETRPPPINSNAERLEVTKPRDEIIRECKKSCAVSKEQLLLGKPKQPKPAASKE